MGLYLFNDRPSFPYNGISLGNLVTYPLRAPLVKPSTILFLTKNAKSKTGKTMMVAAAPMPAQSIFP